MFKSMKLTVSALFVAGLMATAPAMADQALAQKSNCLACHSKDKAVVGPAFADIAKKYAGDANAVKTLSAKVKAGGSGTWGAIPMPPNATISDADVETLVKWILAGAN